MQPARVRARDLEDVEVGIQLDADGAERRDRLVEGHEPARQPQVERVDQVEPLADHLDRVDARDARAVVAVEEVLDRVAQLLLALLRVAQAELGEAPRQRVDVLGRRVDEEPRQARHVLVGQPSREPEVDEADAPVVEQEDVRRVRVAVEEPVAEDHRHPRVGHPVGELAALLGRARLEVEVGELRPLEELERQHPRRRVAPDHLRHGDLGRVAEVAPERLGVARLVLVVELLPDRAGELVDERLGIDEVERAHALADDAGGRAHQLQVGLDLARRLRALHLDDDLVARRQRRPVHLADRRGRDRRLVEAEEGLLERQARSPPRSRAGCRRTGSASRRPGGCAARR